MKKFLTGIVVFSAGVLAGVLAAKAKEDFSICCEIMNEANPNIKSFEKED